MPTECILLGCGLVSWTIMGGQGRPRVLPSLGQWDRRDPIPLHHHPNPHRVWLLRSVWHWTSGLDVSLGHRCLSQLTNGD